MKILVVDNIQARHDRVIELHPNDEITSLYTVEQSCSMLAFRSYDHFDIVYLDHDAGDDTTFYPVACMLSLHGVIAYLLSHHIEPLEYLPEVRIISANPVGAERMRVLIKNAGLNVCVYDLYSKTLNKER